MDTRISLFPFHLIRFFFKFPFAAALVLLLGVITSCSGPEGSKESSVADSTDAAQKHNSYVFSDSTTYSERPVDSTFAEPISGMVQDMDMNKVYIKVFPSRELKACGLALEDVEKGKHKKDVKQAIAAIISVGKAFSGSLTLHAYDYEKNLLGSSTVILKGAMGDRATLNFPFTEKTDFSLIDYCTLDFEE
jgi:hypothetical protein